MCKNEKVGLEATLSKEIAFGVVVSFLLNHRFDTESFECNLTQKAMIPSLSHCSGNYVHMHDSVNSNYHS